MTVLDALRRTLPAELVVADPDVLASLSVDNARAVPPGRPAAAVRARTTEHVQATVRAAAASGVPVVPRGAGSGLSGGATAVDGCVVLSTAAMDRVLEINPRGMYAVVQPGVVNATLCRAVAQHGLFYAPDPASREFSTIGGNVATNAGGLCCVKYGVTGDAVLALEVVLADGSVLRTGSRTVKDVAGLDLTRLFVGSEGALGVVTEVTVRLLPPPPPQSLLVASFDSLADAGAAITEVVTRVRPSLLEIMDAATIRAVEAVAPMGIEPGTAALVLARVDTAGDAVAAVTAACTAAGAMFVHSTDDAAEAELLMQARRLALPALERLGETILDDVAVPLDRLTGVIARIGEIAAEHEVVVGTFGHAGDGNLHPTLVVPHGDSAGWSRAMTAFDAILDAAVDAGGTVTGEHGVGALKVPALARQLDPVAAGVQRSIKQALDPEGLFNPGKAIPAVEAAAAVERRIRNG